MIQPRSIAVMQAALFSFTQASSFASLSELCASVQEKIEVRFRGNEALKKHRLSPNYFMYAGFFFFKKHKIKKTF